MNIDVTMTATRRPDLIMRTLGSFQCMLFERLPVRTFFLNIDPLWGTEKDDVRVERIARSFFADVRIRRPETPSFGAAVKWLWAQPETEWFLHMEDDWIVNFPLKVARIEAECADPDISQIRLANWSRLTRRRRAPSFCTGPSFVRSSFAQHVAGLMNPDLDPEKQMLNPRNPALAEYMAGLGVRYHGHALTPCIVTDIGRDWRGARMIGKQIVNGASVWSVP